MGLFPASVEIALAGIPRGYKSKVYVVDPVNGSDSNPGTKWDAPLLTVKKGYDKTVTNQNDAVLLVPSPTANALAAAFAWAHDYTHLVGLTPDLPGAGQRCRITGSAALDLLYLIDFQCDGSLVKNLQFFNGYDAATHHGAVIASGERNEFENVAFVGLGGAVAGTSSYDLWLTGDESCFRRCTIGGQTMANGIANSRLLISGETGGQRCQFIKSEFLNWSTVTTAALVRILNTVTCEGFVLKFEDCLFDNLLGGATMAHAIVDGATETHHQIILRGKNEFIGVGAVTDVAAYTWSSEPAPAGAGAHIALNNLTT